MMNQKVNFRGLEMLPIANEMVNDDINDAHAQLTVLTQDLLLSEIFTNDRLQGLVNTYTIKIAQTDYIKYLSQQWRNHAHLSDQQKNILNSLDLGILRMESITVRPKHDTQN